jgi:hypothetical protein
MNEDCMPHLNFVANSESNLIDKGRKVKYGVDIESDMHIPR